MAQYQQIYQSLKHQVLSGAYVYGDLLPSENELKSRFETTRVTVRQALNKLVTEGYITRQHGKGSIVTLKRNTLGLLTFRGFSEALGSVNLPVRTVELAPAINAAFNEPFFFQLSDAEQKAGCINLTRLRFAADDPVMLEYTYIPRLLENFLDTPFEDKSLFSTLRKRYGIEITNVEQELRAIRADKEVASLLKVNADDPIIHIYRRYITSRSNFYVYSSLFCCTHQYSLGNIFNAHQ